MRRYISAVDEELYVEHVDEWMSLPLSGLNEF